MEPTTKNANHAASAPRTKGDCGPSASGWVTGSRVSVSAIPGTHIRKKLNENPSWDR
ncbi:hypothetical protein D9M68_873730 [compost metagenome]